VAKSIAADEKRMAFGFNSEETKLKNRKLKLNNSSAYSMP